MVIRDHACRPSTNIKHGDAEFLLLWRQHCLCRSKRRKEDAPDLQLSTFPTFIKGLDYITGCGDHLSIHLQTHTRGANWLPAALLPVDQKLLRKDMKNLIARWECNSTSDFKDALDISTRHLTV